MKKIIQLSLILTLSTSLIGCGNQGTASTNEPVETTKPSEEIEVVETDEGKYPTQWDLSDFYEDEEAWQSDYDLVIEMFDQYDAFVGKINNVQDIYEYLEFSWGGELTEKQSALANYANLLNSLNRSDETSLAMLNKLSIMERVQSEKNAFFENELLSIPYEERIEILNDPILSEYRHALEKYFEENRVAKSEETIRSEAILKMADGAGSNAASSILYLDLSNPEITLPDGTTIEMNDTEYRKIISNSEYSRELKNEALRLRMTKTVPYINTLTATLEGTMKEYYSYALLEGYDSTRQYLMDQEGVDAEVYDLLINNVHDMLPDYQRYMRLHGEALGLDEQYSYDLGTSVSSFSRDIIPYDDAVDEVREAIGIYGQDYVDYYDAIVENEHVDVYPAAGKQTGAFMEPSSTTTLPYVLYNYGGSYSDVSTIAHEMGHALYGSYAQNFQPVQYRVAGIFTQEVASTLNELILVNYKMNHATSDEEKLYYLEYEINLLNGTIFSQVLYAEFEDSVYQMVENGEALTADKLNALWQSLDNQYNGDAVINVDEAKYFWSLVPHFYYGYYVYKYASSISYATSIYASLVGENGQEAIDSYIEFLKAGASENPRELLQIAGIDINEAETYEKAKIFYQSLIDEYEILIQANTKE